jgi:hypothetical protein
MGEWAKAKQVIALNDKGFAWQSSIGARADQVEFVPEGKSSQANGREFAGPVNIARRATLGEISFVVLGADDNTSAQIAASAQPTKELDMEFAAWIEAQGFTPDALNDAQTKNLRALYDVQAAKPTTPVEPPPNATVQIRAEAIAELERINAIRKACDGRHPEIETQAIKEGWDATKTELAVRGDQIEETDGGVKYVYEVMAPAGQTPWRYADDFRRELRIHTKHVKTATA